MRCGLWNNGALFQGAAITMNSPTWLLLGYCVAIAAVSLAGGLLPSLVRMTHTRTQLVMSLVSGLMLGVAFYHLLPHSIAMQEADNAADIAVWWLMLGLVAMLLLLRLFHFHQHDFSHEEHLPHANDHQHAHHDHMAPASPHVHSLSGIGIGLGLALHTLIDGVALGAVMLGGEALGGWLGIDVDCHRAGIGGLECRLTPAGEPAICTDVPSWRPGVLFRDWHARQWQSRGGGEPGFFGGCVYLYCPE